MTSASGTPRLGRFAPSPTGRLHLGNLRTALVAWLAARQGHGRFVVRMEDLDRVTSSAEHARDQCVDLESIGLDWDGPVVFQSERFALYDAAIEQLASAGRVYECFCTRREIREASQAPHADGPEGAYPGTCRELTAAARASRVAEGRPPALRLDARGAEIVVVDECAGPVRLAVDDVVLRRNDGVPAYNLAVVVDDALQGVSQVVRGDDLLSSTPRQVLLQRLLGVPTPDYLHVPLALGADGVRLAKRHGAVTLPELTQRGWHADDVRSLLAVSLGLADRGERVTMADLLARFDPSRLDREPWVVPEDLQRSAT